MLTNPTPTPTLRRIHRATLTERRRALFLTAIVCTRCLRSARPHLVERDPRTGEFAHIGNCPYAHERR